MSYNNGPGPIPNRWLYCPRNGQGFIAGKFLPFKTPLSARFASQMPEECQFEPEMVFSYVKMLKMKIGLWIDLTNTSRFYDRREVESRGAQYRKMQCRGHGETPTKEQTDAFIEMVEKYITQSPLDMIGVHCTHGFNRTGFLIVSYMVEKQDWSVEAALLEFAKVRPPGIYKEDYIKELFRRYEDEEDAPPGPPLPDWCNQIDVYQPDLQHQSTSSTSRKRSFNEPPATTTPGTTGDPDDDVGQDDNLDDGDDDEDAVINNADGSSSGQSPAKKRRKQYNVNATFMAGVQGVHLVRDIERITFLQDMVQTMCQFKKKGFPGCQPVSMDLNNMKLLHKMPYQVSWKADGTRYMMLIVKEGQVFFIDRDNSIFQVEGLRFVNRLDLKRHLENTLLDGEMVIDTVNGLTTPRYLVYDIVQFNGKQVSELHFYKNRLDHIKHEIVGPRYEAIRLGLINRSIEPFSIRMKDFWGVTHAEGLLGEKFAKMLLHEPDGLIFQPSLLPYKCGPCPEVLKWKPAELNSVDFKLQICKEGGMGILPRKVGFLFVGKLQTPFAQIKYTKALSEMDGKIIECKFENNSWVFMRERTDKSFPNSKDTAEAVCHSIRYPVTKEILLNFIQHHRYQKDGEIMPPPPAPARHT